MNRMSSLDNKNDLNIHFHFHWLLDHTIVIYGDRHLIFRPKMTGLFIQGCVGGLYNLIGNPFSCIQ